MVNKISFRLVLIILIYYFNNLNNTFKDIYICIKNRKLLFSRAYFPENIEGLFS